MQSDAEVMVVVIEHLLRTSKNKTFREGLQEIVNGLKGKTFIEEEYSPQYKSIILFERNIFPYSMKIYRELAEEIRKETI
jgi:hypothetical protein